MKRWRVADVTTAHIGSGPQRTGYPVTADPPRRLPAWLRDDWVELTAPTTGPVAFDPAMAAHLPDPARRWLCHAIAPGTPLRRAALLAQHGRIRLGAWRPFTAVQALAPLDGFIWVVTTDLLGVPIHGFDRFSRGVGQMRHRAFGVLPLLAASGPDLDRSAAARGAAEFVWVPAVGLDPRVTWQQVDDDRATAVVPCGRWRFAVTLTVSPTGTLTAGSFPRWTDVSTGSWHEEVFTAEFDGEDTFGGFTVPTRSTAGWGCGTARWAAGGAFIDQRIDAVTYR